MSFEVRLPSFMGIRHNPWRTIVKVDPPLPRLIKLRLPPMFVALELLGYPIPCPCPLHLADKREWS